MRCFQNGKFASLRHSVQIFNFRDYEEIKITFRINSLYEMSNVDLNGCSQHKKKLGLHGAEALM